MRLGMGHGAGHRDGGDVVAAAGGADVGRPVHPGEVAASKAAGGEEG